MATLTEREEIERYQKLLEDWKPAPPSKKWKTQPVASGPARPAPAAPAAPTNGQLLRQPGAILKLGDGPVVIYLRPVPQKEYHLVLALFPNGSIKTQGVALDAYPVEELGAIPPVWLERMQQEMRWNRDLIVFHCYSYDDVRKLPDAMGAPADAPPAARTPVPSPKAQPEAPAARPPDDPQPAPPRRGSRLQIRFGNNVWDAIYWGKDDQGHVVAHQTNNQWALMHLDLDRFGNGVQVDPNPDLALVEQIEKSLLAQ